MSKDLERFQILLRELFQFDCADLDFGLYRILNARRDLFEDWIDNRLPEKVRHALSRGVLKDDAGQAERLARLAQTLRDEHGEACIDGDGLLGDAISGKTASEYRALWQARHSHGGPQAADALEADIYNRLYDFFRRYYEDGDFLSLRRYGAGNAYAVPYNGEEVLLHWANKDQYYVKTGEHFTDYRFRAGDKADAWHVDFKLTRAESDRDNTKAADKRYFFFDVANAEVDAAARVLTVPVVYRAATETEAEPLGRNGQDALNDDVAKKLPAKQKLKAQPALQAALQVNVSDNADKPQTLLARHLRRYTRRNTSDFFIHKDLQGFLSGELDYWLKAEVLKLDALLAGGEQAAQGWLQKLGALRDVAAEIIGFLSQVENFQKRLFEKRKFVTECHWCITLDHVERAGLTDALVAVLNSSDGGKQQKAEWKHLFAIDEVKAHDGKPGWKDKVSAEFLRSQPFLVLDTALMPQDFTDRLLASFDDLEDETDGVLVHSENLQALNLLAERYREEVQCIYIDPPYNAKTSEIIYKNTYKHSSWIAMMASRISTGEQWRSDKSTYVIAIDENEHDSLKLLMKDLIPNDKQVSVSVVHNPRGIQGDAFSYTSEYAVFSYRNDDIAISEVAVPETQWEYSNLRNWGGESERGDGRSCFYPIYVQEGRVDSLGEVPEDDFHPKARTKVQKNGRIEIWPIDGKGVERKWRYKASSLKKVLRAVQVVGQGGDCDVKIARYAEAPRTVWADSKFDASTHGTRLLKSIVPETSFSFPKSIYTVMYSLRVAGVGESGVVLDFFGGSGTTAHAVIAMNREDDGNRKYILCEMGAYFDSTVRPRVQRIVYDPVWNDGRPQTRQGSSQVFKYFRLESYEDTLSNLQLSDAAKGQGALDLMPDFYRLGYWLDVETQGSDSLLNIDRLEAPFEYTLILHDGRETQVKPVDLTETFAYLIGLIVERRQVLDRDGCRYLLHIGRQRSNDARTAVLWRDIRSWSADNFDAERRWVAEQNLLDGVRVTYVNGDSAIDGAQSLDPVLHARMFAPVH